MNRDATTPAKAAVVALGANKGDREAALAAALRALDALCATRVTAVSRVYETEPVGYADQPRFLNAAAALETALSPRALLGACLGIEAALGRRRGGPANGPRVLDIDLLSFEGTATEDAELTLPHPRAKERAFVLAPLADLYPDGNAPGLHFADCLAALPSRLSREGVLVTSAAIWIP